MLRKNSRTQIKKNNKNADSNKINNNIIDHRSSTTTYSRERERDLNNKNAEKKTTTSSDSIERDRERKRDFVRVMK
jgi:hypothetical protein